MSSAMEVYYSQIIDYCIVMGHDPLHLQKQAQDKMSDSRNWQPFGPPVVWPKQLEQDLRENQGDSIVQVMVRYADD